MRSPVLTIAVFCLSALGMSSALGPFWAHATSLMSGTAMAGAIAFVNAVGNLGGFLGPYMFGLIKDATGGSDLIALVAIGAAPVISAVVLVALGHDTRLERIPPKAAAAE